MVVKGSIDVGGPLGHLMVDRSLSARAYSHAVRSIVAFDRCAKALQAQTLLNPSIGRSFWAVHNSLSVGVTLSAAINVAVLWQDVALPFPTSPLLYQGALPSLVVVPGQ